ncbi:MAG: hypothetical protein U0271_24800 [Polyangiaceae bacterium]
MVTWSASSSGASASGTTSASTGAQARLPTAVDAGLALTPPEGIDFTIPALPTDAAFQEPADKWWKSANPCPKGSVLKRIENTIPKESRKQNPNYDFDYTLLCHQQDGRINGGGVTFWPDGKKMEEFYEKDGAKHGLKRAWYRGGKLKSTEYYDMNVQVGVEKYVFENGEIAFEGPFVAGKRHGLWIDGTDWGLAFRGYYVEGKKEGPWLGEAGGVTTFNVSYKKGLLDGHGEFFDFDRTVVAIGTFDKGAGTWTFYRKGVRAAEYTCSGELLTAATWYDQTGVVTETFSSAKPGDVIGFLSRQYEKDQVCRDEPILLIASKLFGGHG